MCLIMRYLLHGNSYKIEETLVERYLENSSYCKKGLKLWVNKKDKDLFFLASSCFGFERLNWSSNYEYFFIILSYFSLKTKKNKTETKFQAKEHAAVG